jgi:thiol:disulfide interchange protein DsbD
MEEKGEVTKFHDADYEMEITWYTGVLSFVQRVRLAPQTTHIKGTIEYMTCNDYTCIPDKQDFNINIDPKKKSL